MKFHLLSATVLAAAFVFAAAASAFAADPIYYELRKGDTLFSIARKYDIPYEALAAANGIDDPTRLRIGEKLVIPELYKVEAGDSLSGIAKAYGITTDGLRKTNKLGGQSVLQPGDILVIPASRFVPGAPKVKAPLDPPTSTTATSTTVKPAVSSTSTTTKSPSAASTTTAKPVPAPTVTTVAKPLLLPTSTTEKTFSPSSTTATSVRSTTTLQQPQMPVTSSLTLPPEVPAIRTATRPVDRKLAWPCPGEYMYLDGKLEGIMVRTLPGEAAKAVANGMVVSAGPARGFGLVAFVQSASGYIYVYGGNEKLSVAVGESVKSGQEIGTIGVDAKDGGPVAYFIVFRDGTSIDPARAPRD